MRNAGKWKLEWITTAPYVSLVYVYVNIIIDNSVQLIELWFQYIPRIGYQAPRQEEAL